MPSHNNAVNNAPRLPPYWQRSAAGKPDREVQDMITVEWRSVAAGATDPYFANVSFLLQPTTEVSGSTTFTDKSSNNLAITPVGSPTWDAGATLLGLPTMPLNGSQHLRLPKNAAVLAFGSSDFTIEAWVLRSNANTSLIYAGQSDLSTPAGSSYITYLSSSANSDIYIGQNTYSVTSPNPSTGLFAFAQWVKSGGTWQTRLDGNVVANSSVGTGSINTGTANYFPSIGRLDTGGASAAAGLFGLNGRIAALRITNGVARPATVPTAPFPTQ